MFSCSQLQVNSRHTTWLFQWRHEWTTALPSSCTSALVSCPLFLSTCALQRQTETIVSLSIAAFNSASLAIRLIANIAAQKQLKVDWIESRQLVCCTNWLQCCFWFEFFLFWNWNWLLNELREYGSSEKWWEQTLKSIDFSIATLLVLSVFLLTLIAFFL